MPAFDARINPFPSYNLVFDATSGAFELDISWDAGGAAAGVVPVDLLDAIENYVASLPNYVSTLSRTAYDLDQNPI